MGIEKRTKRQKFSVTIDWKIAENPDYINKKPRAKKYRCPECFEKGRIGIDCRPTGISSKERVRVHYYKYHAPAPYLGAANNSVNSENDSST